MSTGRPVIAYGAGGALETVKPGVSGVLFEDQTWEAIADCIIRFKPETFEAQTIRQWADTFSVSRFKQELGGFIDQAWQNRANRLG